MIDGSIIKAHQHSCGAKKGRETSIGKSVAGNTSKIHMVTDSHGNPIDFGNGITLINPWVKRLISGT